MAGTKVYRSLRAANIARQKEWDRDQDRRPCAWIEPGAKERNLRIEDVRRFAA